MLRAMLNWIWAAFFLIAFVVAVWQSATGGKPDAVQAVVSALFDSSKTGFEIALGLTGVMSLWLGRLPSRQHGGITPADTPPLRPPRRPPLPRVSPRSLA